MRPEEITALGELLGDAAAGATSQIREMHSGIAGRVWRAVGPASRPVQLAHDRIADGAYAAARRLTRTLVRGGAAAASVAAPVDGASIDDRPAGRLAVGAVNGMFGDTLARGRNALSLRMSVRSGGRDVELTRAGLRRAFPEATPRLAVFVHGLCETDESWKLGQTRHVPYGFRLKVEMSYTPLYVRYNSGRHISENGREFAQLLERLTDAWPTEVHEVVLIGHSMGGLVARSGCHYGPEREWTSKVRHVFTLGSPHKGAPLEQAANAASYAFSQLPETRMLAKALNIRSSGIKDLRYGYLVDECWLDQDCDAFLRNTSRDVPFLRTANHYFVCATVSREPDALAGRLIGDLLVLQASAWAHEGKTHRLRFPIEQYRHLGGANHFDLLNHPAIYEQIKRWLMSRRALPARVAA